MSQPSQREYSETPAWSDSTVLARLRNLSWIIESISEDRRPHFAVARSQLFHEFEVYIFHSWDSVSGQRYHSFVPVRRGRGVNFLTPEKMHRDVVRRTGRFEHAATA